MTTNKNRNVRVEDDVWERVGERAAALAVTSSDVVRAALDRELALPLPGNPEWEAGPYARIAELEATVDRVSQALLSGCYPDEYGDVVVPVDAVSDALTGTSDE